MVEDLVENLSGPLMLRMVHTKDGAEVGVAVITAGGARERKKIVKVLKGTVGKVLEDEYGNVVLLRLLDLTDDTTLINKVLEPGWRYSPVSGLALRIC
jgi:pumilio family protein 6